MTFRVGQKVVCVNSEKFRNMDLNLSGGLFPKKGMIYTVRGFSIGGHVLLDEIVELPHLWLEGYGEGGWLVWRFRPVVERKTDISIFTAMLKPSKVEA